MKIAAEFSNFPKVQFESTNSTLVDRAGPQTVDSTGSAINRILLMTDFSPNGRAAYKYAAALAEKHSAEIALTHFGRRKPPDYSGISIGDYRRNQFERLDNELRSSELAHAQTRSRLFIHGNIPEAVRNFEEAVQCDLVVVYVSATTRFGRFSSIDYAGDLLTGSSVPVLLVGPKALPAPQANTGVVLIPFDLRRDSGAPFHAFDWIARHFDYALHVAQVAPLNSTERPRWFNLMAKRQQARNQRRADVLAQQIASNEREFPSSRFDLQSGEQIAPSSVNKRARELNARLIVVSAGKRLRNRALNLLHGAPCPVLTMPDSLS